MTSPFVPHGDQASDIDRYDTLPSRAGSASDGTECLAPIDAVWNSSELRDAYRSMAVIGLYESLRGAAAADCLDITLGTLRRLWAADYAFRPFHSDGGAA